jgi:subtilisin family serine protease
MLKNISLMSAGILMTVSLSFAQGGYQVQRGERPPIDYDRIEESSYDKGILLIKFISDLSTHLENNPVIKANKVVLFGLDGVDALNQQYRTNEAARHFLSPALGNTFTARHKAWGFHLWYKLEFDETIDIKQLIREYSALREIEIAEPSFKKTLIGHVESSENSVPADEGDGSPGLAWTPYDPMYNTQWHYHNTGQQSGTPDADIDLPEAWDIEKGNSDVVVAIIDDGIQFNHPDLATHMWQNSSGDYGYNFVTNSSTIEPGNHGTHVAGTVSAINNNGEGVAGVAGGSGFGDGVRLMSCQVFNSTNQDGFHLALIYAADNGAAISQNSWGYENPGVYNQSVLDAIDYFNLNGGGGAMIGGISIFAAGNNNASGAYYPGYYSGAFAVAGTNNQDQKGWYSNYGSWIDISAPGGETHLVTAKGVRSTLTENNYGYYQGTSMACPHVSGVAALIVSLGYGSFTAIEIKNILKNTTDNVDAQNPGFIGQLGTGRLNAHSALIMAQGMFSGVLNPATFTAIPASTTQINLVWTKNVSNNSVMVVWSPTGTFGLPSNGATYNPGQSIPGGGTVLYRGSNTNYNHSGLNHSTTYYYKAFSYDASNDYSSGKTVQGNTVCGVVTLPFNENFDAVPSLPACWEIIDNQGNEQMWEIGYISGFDGNNPNLTGNYAYLNSDGFGSGNTQNSDLVTPTINLSGYTNITLSFQHFFRQYSSASTGSVAYSINNGATWTTIQTWTSTTANPEIFSQEIPAVAGQSQVKFRWNYQGTFGFYWAVDDFNITASSYCIPSYTTGSSEGDYISLVQLGNINNSTGALPSPYYFYYDYLSTDLIHGNSYTVNVSAGSYPTGNNISAWIDFNQNGIFEVSEKLGNVTLGALPQTGAINFTVPAGATPGVTRMRVREVYNVTDIDPCLEYLFGETEDYNVNILNSDISLDMRVFLEGPFSGNQMNTNLGNLIPITQPYNGSPWNYAGTESVGSVPANVVDWVLVELRDAPSAATATDATMVDRQAAFVLDDGSIVGLDGSTNLIFPNSITHQLFVVILHRNHLGIMSANAVTPSGGIYSYDFTTGSATVHGGDNGHKQLAAGVWGMVSGDSDRDGVIGMGDKSGLWESEAGTEGYIFSDYNLDRQSNNIDKDSFWGPNIGKGSQVPN